MEIIKSTIISIVVFSFSLVANNPEREFLSGYKTQFSTYGHPKSKGINMHISYPNSWLAQEGNRPNVVQKIFSEGGKGLEGIIIITKNLPLPEGTIITEDELLDFFTPSELRTMIPPNAIFIGAKQTRIENIPAGILEYSLHQERAGMKLDSQYINYIFIYKTTMVQIQCMVTAGLGSTQSQLSQKMEEFKPLFFLIANSIVLPDIWK